MGLVSFLDPVKLSRPPHSAPRRRLFGVCVLHSHSAFGPNVVISGSRPRQWTALLLCLPPLCNVAARSDGHYL
ncbi:Hypothetical predicted protein [Cloeon dipterum]|uniref:Uncharacterized protein n=1 Tax=Cloeon dipterum TaxID=197152 RepID=A0A8S1CZ93_9INSE|nr:Hypothetical predicted protein [Cloeon dipterum]